MYCLIAIFLLSVFSLTVVNKNSTSDPISYTFPTTLFRYRTFCRALSEITKEYIWFSNPLDNNDPFDSWPSIKGCDQDLRQQLSDLGQDSEGFLADSACGDRIMIVIGHILELLEHYSICCFSTRIDALQLWSLYADHHTGICIEYDVSAIKKIGSLGKVRYSKEMLSRPFKDSTSPDKKELVKAFFNKSIEYASEDEWRIVKNGKGETKLDNAIVGVYLGTNYRHLNKKCRPQLKLLLQHCEDKKIPLYYMRRSFTEYKLTPTRIIGDDLSIEGQLERFNLEQFIKNDV